MGIILWIIFGGLAGWIASVFTKTDYSQGTVMDIIMGIIGAVVGGYLMETLGQSGITGFNFRSLFVAVVGSIVVIYLARIVRR